MTDHLAAPREISKKEVRPATRTDEHGVKMVEMWPRATGESMSSQPAAPPSVKLDLESANPK
jgi:hypothetical protein